ncbi:NTP transferase domain-containing protein [Chenggangzhangella methanolivorans]|uniref:NTP transferase domain-containing protein n=1 Tax=Chenggangzhangella methanolivorans TaxID=1437009 RepID=A0A9E6RI33_9HYPH|nr:NTP transferase domain-containing protein [Chenggangzhangella methanolivorans]QZO01417.1 NTP transferase domain-containing protein [Chenggangzhangella methanolivorans]
MTAALILAGTRRGGDKLAEAEGVSHKTLIEVGGRPMLERVVDALRASGRIDRILVSINKPKLVKIPGVETIKSAKSLAESVIEGVNAIGAPAFVTTGDHALLEPEWIRYFIDNAPDVDLALGIARAEAVSRDAPDTERTFIKLADGQFSGCNMFYVRHIEALRGVEVWREFEQLRKRPFKMLQKLGPSAIFAYATGRLTTERVAKEVGRLTGGLTAGIVDMPFGRSAIDVDKPADLELVRRLLEREAA